MKVYKVEWRRGDGVVFEWFATKAEAKQAIREIKDAKGEDAEVFDEPSLYDIPTDKKGLVRWLNLWHGGELP